MLHPFNTLIVLHHKAREMGRGLVMSDDETVLPRHLVLTRPYPKSMIDVFSETRAIPSSDLSGILARTWGNAFPFLL